MMSGRAVGCSLADAFSGPTVTPTVATYQSRLATAQAQTSSHAKQQAATASPYAAAAAYAPAPAPAAAAAPPPSSQMWSDSDSDSDEREDDEAYRRFVRKERRKRREKKAKSKRWRQPVETDTETDSDVVVETPAVVVPPPTDPTNGFRNDNIVVAQGKTSYRVASSYINQSVGQASFAGALPAQGFSVAAATMGPPGSCVPQNPLGVDFGTGSNMYATGYPNNGMPQTVLDGRFDTIRSDRRDLAGTFVDPITGIAYAGFTDSMPEPKVMREPPTVKLGEPNRMLEALTGVPAYKRPIRQEVLNDFSDVLEGVQIPQGLLELQTRDNAAKRVAADTFFTNNETEAGFNDTHWDGYIGDTFVLRPVIDTQTLADNSQTNTVVAPFRTVPDIYSSPFQINDGTQWGGPLQPSVTVLGRDKATLPGRGSVDMPMLGQHVRLPGIPTQLPFSDDTPTTHSNTPFVPQDGGGGGSGAASLAAVGESNSYDASRASTGNQTADMPYRLYVPPVAAVGTGGSARDAAVPAGAVFTDVSTNSNTSQRLVASQDGVGAAASDAMHVRSGSTLAQAQGQAGTEWSVGPAAATTSQSVRAHADEGAALQRLTPGGGNGNANAATSLLPTTFEAASMLDASVSTVRNVPSAATMVARLPGGVQTGGQAFDVAAASSRPVVIANNQYQYGPAGPVTDPSVVTDGLASTHRVAVALPTFDTSDVVGPRVMTAHGVADATPNGRPDAVLHDFSGFQAGMPASAVSGQSRDARVQSAQRGATADQDFPYATATVGMAAAAPERHSAVDAALAPTVLYAGGGIDGNAAYSSRSGITSVANMVGAIEKASRRMASVSSDDPYLHFRSAEGATSAAPGHDAAAALAYNTYGGGVLWKTAPDALPAVYDAANVVDDGPGALRVDVAMTSTGDRLQGAQHAGVGRDDTSALSSGAATSAFRTSGARLAGGVRQGDMGTDAVASTRQANTYDSTSGRDATLTWSWDGPGQSFDDTPRPASLNATAAYETAAINLGQASDRPAQLKAGSETTPRIANDMTLFSTGQSMLPTPTLQSMPSQKDVGRDATKEVDAHVGHTSLLRDAFLSAHPSTYGKAAEYRNAYKTTTRAGIFVENLQTQRAAGHPELASRDGALARQQARNEAVRRHEQRTGNGMNVVRVAYESDAYASDA